MLDSLEAAGSSGWSVRWRLEPGRCRGDTRDTHTHGQVMQSPMALVRATLVRGSGTHLALASVLEPDLDPARAKASEGEHRCYEVFIRRWHYRLAGRTVSPSSRAGRRGLL